MQKDQITDALRTYQHAGTDERKLIALGQTWIDEGVFTQEKPLASHVKQPKKRKTTKARVKVRKAKKQKHTLLTATQKREVRLLAMNGTGTTEIAKKFKVSPSTVRNILNAPIPEGAQA